MWPALHVAQEVGKGLGRSQVLLRQVQRQQAGTAGRAARAWSRQLRQQGSSRSKASGCAAGRQRHCQQWQQSAASPARPGLLEHTWTATCCEAAGARHRWSSRPLRFQAATATDCTPAGGSYAPVAAPQRRVGFRGWPPYTHWLKRCRRSRFRPEIGSPQPARLCATPPTPLLSHTRHAAACTAAQQAHHPCPDAGR